MCGDVALKDAGVSISATAGQSISVRFNRPDTPLVVEATVSDQLGGAQQPLAVSDGNPANLAVNLPVGLHWVTLHTRWPEGESYYLFKLQVQ